MNSEDEQRYLERQELIEICLDLLGTNDPEARLRAGSSLVKFLDADAKHRSFLERHEAKSSLLKVADDLQLTAEGLGRLSEWFKQEAEKL